MSSADVSERQDIIRDSTRYLAATIVGQAFGLIRAVVIPVLFSPAQLGVWNLMTVILSYGANGHLGVLHGMNKAIPSLRAQGRADEVDKMKDTVFWMNLFLGGLAMASLWCASFFVPVAYASSLRIVGITVICQLLFYYHFSLLRADNRFALVSRGVAAYSILTTVAVVSLAIAVRNSLAGALIGVAVANILVVVYWFAGGHYRFVLQFNSKALLQALTLGVPLIVLGLLDSVFISIDRWVIASTLGEIKLGYYALGLMASNLIGVVTGSVASVLYPRMLQRFAMNGNPADAKTLFVGPVRAMAAVIPVLTCTAAIIFPVLIRMFMPSYLPSIAIVQILIVGAFFMAIAAIPGSYMVAVDKQNWLIAIQVTASLFILTVDTLLLRSGYGVLGVAVSTVCGYALYAIGYTWCAAFIAIGNGVHATGFVVRLLIPFAASAVAIHSANFVSLRGDTLVVHAMELLTRLGCVIAVLIGALWLTNRDGQLWTIMRSEILPGLIAKTKRATHEQSP